MSVNVKKDGVTTNPWDTISERFNTFKYMDDIHPDAAVNIYLGWPTFLQQIKYQADYMGKQYCKIMDFGCGAGEFCKRMSMEGHRVYGVDASQAMLDIAEGNTPTDIQYIYANHHGEQLLREPSIRDLDIITSMHVMDWIEDVDDMLEKMGSLLVDNGLLLFSVFPKKHVIEQLAIKDLFEDFDSETDPKVGVCNFDGVKIPVYVHEADYYDALFERIGFDKVIEAYPPFPKVFFEKYNWTGASYPEMMILGYRKLPKS